MYEIATKDQLTAGDVPWARRLRYPGPEGYFQRNRGRGIRRTTKCIPPFYDAPRKARVSLLLSLPFVRMANACNFSSDKVGLMRDVFIIELSSYRPVERLLAEDPSSLNFETKAEVWK